MFVSPRPHIPKLRRSGVFLPAVLALTLGAGACTSDDPGSSAGIGADGIVDSGTVDIDGTDIELTAGLETFQSCDALLDRLKEEGLERVGPYGFDQGGWFGPMFEGDVVTADAEDSTATTEASAPASNESSDDSGGSDGAASGTNNQEAGVDEADLVKTDGKRMVVVLGNTLRIIDLATDTIEREIDLGDNYYGGELFLSGDSAIVMTSGWSDSSLAADGFVLPQGVNTTRLVQIDLESGDAERWLEFEGGYLSARDIDGTLRIALTAGVGNLGFVYPSSEAATEQAERNNRQVIEESTIEQWLPTYRLSDSTGTLESGTLVDCDRMFLPSEFSGFGALTILTIDASAALDPVDATAVLSDGQTVYASTDRMAIATARWPEFGDDGQVIGDENYHTLIHSFDITQPERADYVASGSVDGHLLNQYSLSSHEGHLRVATTAGDPWNSQDLSESFITVLDERGQTLEPVGKVGGIGAGERIYAVRFMGEMAYVVTFKQIDPLYAIDLSDPTDPTVLGELKIPGFSAYLHPVADGLLMGVGQDASEEGFTSGSQVSLFDVSDPANPQRIDQLSLGDQTYSSVEWDAKAFTWWDQTSTGFVPVSWYRYDEANQSEENGTASVAVQVADRKLVETGRIEHDANRECEGGVTPMPVEEFDDTVSDDAVSEDAEAGFVESAPAEDAPIVDGEYCWSWAPEIRRTVIVDDRIYTISEGGVKISDLASFEALGWLPFVE